LTIDSDKSSMLHAPRPARTRARAAIALVALIATVGVTVIVPSMAEAAEPVGVISDTAVPETLFAPDYSAIEVGMKFSPTTTGTLSGVQFYQNAPNSGVTSASVWSSSGTRLAMIPVDPWAPVGWRTIPVNVALTAGSSYIVSVYDSNSRFPVDSNAFERATTINGITTPADAGMYRYGRASAFPSSSVEGYNFLVDVVFTGANTVSASASTPTATATPSATPTPAATATPTATPAPTVTPTPTTSPTPTAAPSPSVDPTSPSALEPDPTSAVYGPDGTHWPRNTPHEDQARIVKVAATWAAISAAIVANASSADPVVICVAPGTITGGNGATSSSRGVLQSIGNATRASRILVTPCNGIGTTRVGTGTGVAFVGVNGVSIVGIDFSAQKVMIRNSENLSIGYSTVPVLLITANGGSGVRNVDVVEIVAGPEAATGVSYDRVEVKSAGGYDVDGLRFAGFYGAPNYKPDASTGHTDTLQFVTTSGDGTISNVTLEDSVLFQSSDQGIMAGANVSGAITDSAFFGGVVGQLRYPMYAGGDPITLSNLLHGTWTNVAVSDTIVAGTISAAYTFAAVARSSSTAGDRGFTALPSPTIADIDRLAPMPTPARLAAIWD